MAAVRILEALMKTLRISHPAFSGAHRDATVAFYRDLLGMPVVLEQANLDYPSEDHFFFHVGEGNFIAYFLPKPEIDPATYEPARSGSGWMDHLAIDVETGSLEGWAERMSAAGVGFEGPVHRGYERSIYFKDPNGVTVELLEWLTAPPQASQHAAVIARASTLRRARGADLVEDADIRAALAECEGIPRGLRVTLTRSRATGRVRVRS
jgi:catechol 2,3-dioxygenase-like lactoylglutathione lyase family enzyme